MTNFKNKLTIIHKKYKRTGYHILLFNKFNIFVLITLLALNYSGAISAGYVQILLSALSATTGFITLSLLILFALGVTAFLIGMVLYLIILFIN
jgi:hypothetical protein